MSKVRKFARNEAGRDFVVGDIHGAFALLERAMEEANFDSARDRLFSLGDMIDRGPQSHRCLDFLNQPYFFSVMGNHEFMLIDLYCSGEPQEESLEWQANRNGLGWWLDTPGGLRQNILTALRGLPLAIEIDTPFGSVGMVHAEVPLSMSWPQFLEALDSGDDTDDVAIQGALWGSERVRFGDMSGVAGIGRLFVGHTPLWSGRSRLGNVYAVDTAACFMAVEHEMGGGLALAESMTTAKVLVEPRVPQLINLSEGDGRIGSAGN